MKIPIYAPSYSDAAELAAQMNLHLRDWFWDWTAADGQEGVWADVGAVMDHYRQQENQYQRCGAGECPPHCTGA